MTSAKPADDTPASGPEDDANGGRKRKNESRDAGAGASKKRARRSSSKGSGQESGCVTPPTSVPGVGVGVGESSPSRKARSQPGVGSPASPKRSGQPGSPKVSGNAPLDVTSAHAADEADGPLRNKDLQPEAASRKSQQNGGKRDVNAMRLAAEKAVAEFNARRNDDEYTYIRSFVCKDRNGPLFGYYVSALLEGRREPVISEGQVLIAILAQQVAYPDTDWAALQPIRCFYPGRERPWVVQPQALGSVLVVPIPTNKARAAKALLFDGASAGIDQGHWNFAGTLGQGGYGHAGLWVQRDARHRIIDRMVVKETAIPTPVIWAAFEAMATAVCLMKDGALPGCKPPNDWDGEIVHRDIKPANFMLGYPSKVSWQDIPAVKEQFRYADPTLNKYPLGSATDVFAIGKTILCLMGLYLGSIKPTRYDSPNNGKLVVNDGFRKWYPQNLIDLVQRCIEPVPDCRIVATELLSEITRIVQEYPGDFDTMPMKSRRLASDTPVWTKRDMYEMLSSDELDLTLQPPALAALMTSASLSDLADYESEKQEARAPMAGTNDHQALLARIEENAALGKYYRQGLADDLPGDGVLATLESLVQRKGSGHDWANERPLRDFVGEPAQREDGRPDQPQVPQAGKGKQPELPTAPPAEQR
ncbi:hypothetical protein LTR36_004746 [Oleoguttula mirabilis]|uniref:Protein kinase domain-containing protein n=1 Tax=Oleoguttula mirabilis TaxID=1507867 RepID=A0AAV9JG51_9PEZI|nr:hypothetical protein LTR36_004746 [Oleoguttula mirabilis]